MSYLQDFEKLHIGTKTTFLTILGTMPFFFISIYLFKPEMIQIIEGNPLTNIHFYFLLSLCLVISVLWFLMNLILGLQATDYIVEIDKKKKKNENKTDTEEEKKNELTTEQREKIKLQMRKQRELHITTTFIMTFVYSLVYLSIATFLNKELLHWQFKWFILGCFSFIIFRILMVGLGILVTNDKK